MKIKKVFIALMVLFVAVCAAIDLFQTESMLLSQRHFVIKDAEAAERPKVANQRMPREIVWRMLDDDGTNNASIAIGDGEVSITDSATGTYYVAFDRHPFYRAPVVSCTDASTDSSLHLCATGSVDKNGVNILCYTAAASTTLSNFDIMNCRADGWDAREGAL